MAPIYDSDVAEKRWSQAEWTQFEFWEKVEHRLRRNKRFWVISTGLIFLAISSIPVVMDQRPRWVSVATARVLAQEINQLKREASLEHLAFRIRFAAEGGLDYFVERSESCQSSRWVAVRQGSLLSKLSKLLTGAAGSFVLLSPEVAEKAEIPGLVTEFCYDPLQGSAPSLQGQNQVGFGIAPANDLATERFDRLSVLLISGSSAELSFD